MYYPLEACEIAFLQVWLGLLSTYYAEPVAKKLQPILLAAVTSGCMDQDSMDTLQQLLPQVQPQQPPGEEVPEEDENEDPWRENDQQKIEQYKRKLLRFLSEIHQRKFQISVEQRKNRRLVDRSDEFCEKSGVKQSKSIIR